MDGIGDQSGVASMFYQNMLEAPSGTDQRDTSLPGGGDDIVGRLGHVVGTARANDNTPSQISKKGHVDVGGPDDHHVEGLRPDRMIQRLQGRAMVRSRSRRVDDDEDRGRHGRRVLPVGSAPNDRLASESRLNRQGAPGRRLAVRGSGARERRPVSCGAG